MNDSNKTNYKFYCRGWEDEITLESGLDEHIVDEVFAGWVYDECGVTTWEIQVMIDNGEAGYYEL